MKKTNFPTYLSGVFQTYKKEDTDDIKPREILIDESLSLWFEELSVFDTLRYQLSASGLNVSLKIRIPQCKQITSKHVLRIGDSFHEVANIAHFTNKEGFPQSDIRLKECLVKEEDGVWICRKKN